MHLIPRTLTLKDRSRVTIECLPKAAYRDSLARLHADMLVEIERQASELAALRGPTRTGETIDWRLSAADIEAQFRAMAIETEKLRHHLAQTLTRDIHSCHNDCTRAGCVNARLRLDLAQALMDREEARKDARRYQWLRDKGDSTWTPLADLMPAGAEGIDAAIDAAIKAQEAKP